MIASTRWLSERECAGGKAAPTVGRAEMQRRASEWESLPPTPRQQQQQRSDKREMRKERKGEKEEKREGGNKEK